MNNLQRRERQRIVPRSRRMLAVVGSLAMFAVSCAGGGPSSEASSAAEAVAATTETQLQLTSDFTSTQLLDTADGSIAELSSVVTGDRPVLLWYWAPN